MITACVAVEGREWKKPFPTFRGRVNKSWWKRYARHVARFGRREIHRGFWWTDVKERGRLKDLGFDGKITLKSSLKIGWRKVDCT